MKIEAKSVLVMFILGVDLNVESMVHFKGAMRPPVAL